MSIPHYFALWKLTRKIKNSTYPVSCLWLPWTSQTAAQPRRSRCCSGRPGRAGSGSQPAAGREPPGTSAAGPGRPGTPLLPVCSFLQEKAPRSLQTSVIPQQHHLNPGLVTLCFVPLHTVCKQNHHSTQQCWAAFRPSGDNSASPERLTRPLQDQLIWFSHKCFV